MLTLIEITLRRSIVFDPYSCSSHDVLLFSISLGIGLLSCYVIFYSTVLVAVMALAGLEEDLDPGPGEDVRCSLGAAGVAGSRSNCSG